MLCQLETFTGSHVDFELISALRGVAAAVRVRHPTGLGVEVEQEPVQVRDAVRRAEQNQVGVLRRDILTGRDETGMD